MEVSGFLVSPKIILTLAFIAGFWLIKFVWITAINRAQHPLDDKRKGWISVVRNLSNMAMVIAVAMVWLSELQNIAISVAAFTVAIVVATKELLACLLGFFTWATNRPFRVGDWIKINGHYGEVADIDWIKIRMLEVDFANGYTYTGRSIMVMNSSLLTQQVINLNFMRRYVMHKFSIYRENEVNLFALRGAVTDKIEELISPFKDVAKRYSNLISNRLDIAATSTEPFIDIHTTDQAKQVISITLFCPTEEAHHLEQQITEHFMALWYQQVAFQKNTGPELVAERVSIQSA